MEREDVACGNGFEDMMINARLQNNESRKNDNGNYMLRLHNGKGIAYVSYKLSFLAKPQGGRSP